MRPTYLTSNIIGMDDAMLPIPADIGKSTGPILLGYILNWGLYGSLCVQVYYYYVAFPKDRGVLKALVYGLYIIETLQSILIAHDILKIFATGYGNIKELIDPQFTWIVAPIITGLVSCIGQSFFAYRIYTISGSKLSGITIVLLACTQGISAMASGVQVRIGGDLTKVQVEAPVSTVIWLVGSAVCDIIIAAFMTYFLSRRATGFKDTQVLITRILRLTIETGSLTASVAIIDVVLFLAVPNHGYHIAPALVLGKLYANTLVINLNGRLVISNGHEYPGTGGTNSSRNGRLYVSNTDRLQIPRIVPRSRKDEMTVAVDINQEIWNDDIPMDRLDGRTGSRDKVGTVEILP